MRRKKYMQYKALSQVSTDPYYFNRNSVKVFKRLAVLQICFALIERKKQLLKLMYSLYSKRFSSKRIYSRINSVFLPSVERVLYGVSNRVISLTKKTRLFKYFKRKNFQLFTMQSVILSDLLFILIGKRKKPFSRRTLWDHVFYMKQELRQFYPSLTSNMFVELARTFSHVDKGVEWVLFDSGYVRSVWQSRQFVSHGKVKVNDGVLTSCTHVGNVGDMYTIESRSVIDKVQHVTCLLYGLRTFGFLFGRTSLGGVRLQYKYLLSVFRRHNNTLDCVQRSVVLPTVTALDLLNLWKLYVRSMRLLAVNLFRSGDRVLVGFLKKTLTLIDRSLMFSRGAIWNRYV